jgi:hypothetical protein
MKLNDVSKVIVNISVLSLIPESVFISVIEVIVEQNRRNGSERRVIYCKFFLRSNLNTHVRNNFFSELKVQVTEPQREEYIKGTDSRGLF